MPNASATPAAANTFFAIAGGGTVVGWLFLGLPWGLVWLCGCICYGLFRLKAALGILFGIIAAAVLFAPGVFNDAALDRQLAAIEAHERSVAPLDLDGRGVLFLGSSRYSPWDCSDLCRALVEHVPTASIYFGYDRSLDFRYGNGPIDLTGRDIRRFDDPIVPGLPADTPSVPAQLGQIDYIVVENPSYASAALASLVPDVPTFGGMYPTNTLWVEYQVFEAADLSAFDPATQTALVSRFAYTRYTQVSPGLPFFPLGDIDFSHTHNGGLSRWATANAREVAAILCGPESRPFYFNCATIRN